MQYILHMVCAAHTVQYKYVQDIFCTGIFKEKYMKRFQADFYKRLFEGLDNNAVMMRVAEDGTYYPIWCSREFTEMMEGTEEDFIRLESGGTMSTIHPDDRAAVEYLFKHHKTEDGTNSLNIRKYTVKGNEIWVHVHYAFVQEDGEQYAYCTYANITEIKRREQIAETARRERESLRILHGMLNSGPWYMDFDEKGNMTSVTWTNTFRKMLGYESEEDFPNKLESWSNLLHEDDKERVLKEYNETIMDYTGGKTYDVEYQLLTKDRGWRWFHAVGQISRRPDGSPVTYVGMFVDITEKKEAEEKLAERNELLANALREAEQANVAKTSFLSNMSHEIRTPMNAIIGLDSIALKEPGLSERTREQLVKIGGSAKHLLSLINDILDMSRIESGRMTIKSEEFSFSDMLEQINTMIHSQCQDKGITYECRIIGHVNDYYIGDDMKLKQVIINILGNAVKFTPAPGTVSFIVEQVSSYENQSVMRFIMKDTGIGMDKEYLPKIFDAFSQEHEGTSNKYGSTGLGMAITKNIVEMMNGNISVTSEKGVGTEFTVNVTLKNSDRKGHDMEDVKPQEMNVLIIDDDTVACEHAKLILEEVGISADICLSGKEALEMIELRHARQEPYNLILVDWKMPELNGVEVTRKIREKYGDEFTVVILTSFNWDEIMEEAIGAGVDSFIAKPLFASNILSEFSQIIKRKKEDELLEHRAELGGRRVLIAEDMLINAEILKEVLAMRDVEADHAENGEIVVDMFKKSEENYYDAILMDVRMPVMGGLDATEAIRALEREDAKKIPIIAMTANAFDEDVQRSLQAGMNAHLAKPVEPELLYDTLELMIRD